MYGGKNVKKSCWTIGFWSFLDFEKKNLCFRRKVFGRVVKNTLTCPMEHFQINISEWKSWKLEDFRIIFEVFGTMAENLFQGWQNSKRCPREQFMKNFFKRENFALFSDCEGMFTSSEYFCQSCETRNLCIGGSLWGKTFFEIYIIFHTFFGLWSIKRLVGKKIFLPGRHNCNPRVQRHFLRKSTFFKKSFIRSSVLEFEEFFLSIDKK